MKPEHPWDFPWDFLRHFLSTSLFVPFLSPEGLPSNARNSIRRKAPECSAAW
jgi:hypothetical protein